MTLAAERPRAPSYAKIRKFARFGLFGVASSGVLLGAAYVLHDVLALHEYLAAALAYVVSLLFNFAANARFVYRTDAGADRFRRFATTNGAFRAGEYVVSVALMALSGYYLLVMLGVAVVSTFVKFFAYDRLVFRA